jgi:hypothetical protein
MCIDFFLAYILLAVTKNLVLFKKFCERHLLHTFVF